MGVCITPIGHAKSISEPQTACITVLNSNLEIGGVLSSPQRHGHAWKGEMWGEETLRIMQQPPVQQQCGIQSCSHLITTQLSIYRVDRYSAFPLDQRRVLWTTHFDVYIEWCKSVLAPVDVEWIDWFALEESASETKQNMRQGTHWNWFKVKAV